MEVYSGVTQALYHHERGPSTFKSSSLVFLGLPIPAERIFFEDTNRGSKITFQRCPCPKKEPKGSVSVSCVRLFASCAAQCTPKNCAEEVSNPSFKARHSISTRRSLPLGGDHGMLHFVIQSLAVNRTSTKYHSSHNIGRVINIAVSQHLGPLIPQRKQFVSTIAWVSLKVNDTLCLFCHFSN